MVKRKTDKPPAATLATTATQGGAMMAITYSEAVERAKFSLDSHVGYYQWFDDFKPLGLNYLDQILEMRGASYIHHGPEKLILDAKKNPYAFDAMRLGIAFFLKQKETLPPEAKEWLMQYLRGELSRPAKRVGASSKAGWHDTISYIIGGFVAQGMMATRNDVSPATSACDAVADALAELGLEPATFHGVKRIWLATSPNLRAVYCKKRG